MSLTEHNKLKQWTAPLLCGLIFYLALRFVFFVGVVPSDSMSPAIEPGSIIFGTRICGQLAVGDVVVAERNDRLLVKRIAAISGEQVMIEDEVFVVPEGCYYLLGDNAAVSLDSRVWPEHFVPAKAVVARVWGK